MKRRILASVLGIAASLVTVASSSGQGSIFFDNYNAANETQVTYGNPAPPGFGPGDFVDDSDFDIVVGLYAGKGVLTDSSALTLLGTAQIMWGWYIGQPMSVYIPTTIWPGPGSTVTFQVRGWDTNGLYAGGGTYETSLLRGASALWQESSSIVTLGWPQNEFANGPMPLVITLAACTNPPPQIIQQPANQSVAAGGTAAFSVSATSSFPEVFYQWFFDGTTVVGANSSTLVLTNVQPASAGIYSVQVQGCTAIMSSNASLTVLTVPVFTLQPEGTVGDWGGTVQFKAAASGVPAPAYLWYKDGVSLGWATDSTLQLQDLQLTDGGNYWAVASNSQGSVTSNPALLIVNPAGVSTGLHPFLTISGVIGKTLGIQYTTNISPTSYWITLTNLTLTEPTVEWIDTNVNVTPGGLASRFYRVVAVP